MIESTSPDTNYNLLQIRYGVPMPTNDALDTTTLLPMYSSGISDSLPPRTVIKTDIGRTYKAPEISRKRAREYPSGLFPYTAAAQRDRACCGSSFSFLGEDISLQIQQQQLDVDSLIGQHVS